VTASQCVATLDASAASVCQPQAFEAFFLAIAPLFCGGGDAGTGNEGGADSPAD
jgi:hypothetical protein